MKKYLTIEEADALFKKYYDGETTRAEEGLLQDFCKTSCNRVNTFLL